MIMYYHLLINLFIIINPFISKNDVKKIIKDEFNYKLSNKKINKIFKHLNLTKKKTEKYIVKNFDYINAISKLRDEFITPFSLKYGTIIQVIWMQLHL